MMTSAPKTPTSQTKRQSPQRLLAWTFRRGAQFLSCELLCTSDRRYAVLVTPHWSSGATLIEELASPFLLEHITHVATVDAGGFGLGGALPIGSGQG